MSIQPLRTRRIGRRLPPLYVVQLIVLIVVALLLLLLPLVPFECLRLVSGIDQTPLQSDRNLLPQQFPWLVLIVLRSAMVLDCSVLIDRRSMLNLERLTWIADVFAELTQHPFAVARLLWVLFCRSFSAPPLVSWLSQLPYSLASCGDGRRGAVSC